MDWTTKSFLGVLAAGLMILLLLKRAVENQLNGKDNGRAKKPLYRIDHGMLNIPLPPQSMWMNMGFWKDTDDFPTACRALLEEVLRNAQISQDKVSGNSKDVAKTLSIIDLGFGCGDQCLYIKNVLDNQRLKKGEDQWRRLLKAYVGITLESAHFSIAQERLGLKRSNTSAEFNIHCADAGKPASWALEIRNDVSLACQANDEGKHENWLLGLDTLIHFQPSRWPIIEYANRKLDASFMAYDLCISENLSVGQRIILRIMAFFGQSPFVNWGTIEEYRGRLVAAGYTRERIEIHDISEHVFGPLAGFLRDREVKLQRYGLSIGRFRYAAGMFAWWARTGVVRGCIIIARK